MMDQTTSGARRLNVVWPAHRHRYGRPTHAQEEGWFAPSSAVWSNFQMGGTQLCRWTFVQSLRCDQCFPNRRQIPRVPNQRWFWDTARYWLAHWMSAQSLKSEVSGASAGSLGIKNTGCCSLRAPRTPQRPVQVGGCSWWSSQQSSLFFCDSNHWFCQSGYTSYSYKRNLLKTCFIQQLSLIHIWRCRRAI